MNIDIVKCLHDPMLLGRSLIGGADTWQAWLSFLRAFFGLSLSDTDAALYRECTARAALPDGPFRKGYLICGRGGGKTYMLSVMCVFLACFKDWSKGLALGGRPVVLLVAPTREQGKIALDYITGILEQSPILRQQIWNVTANSVELTTRVTIEIVSANYRSIRGRAICVCLVDECAFLRQEESTSPDVEILNAITPALGRFGKEGILLIGSTPYAKKGVLFDGWRRFFGKESAEAICWVSPTLVMNPSFDAEIIAAEIEADPARARAEYYAEFRDDISAFIDRDIVESCVDSGVHERLRRAGQQYVCFIDSAGGSGQDSFAAAIAHQEDDVVILDAVREYRPPFSPKNVVGEIAQWAKTYGVAAAQSDKWGGEFPIEEFAVHKIAVRASANPKSDIYRDMLPLLNSGKCRLLDNPRLVSQLCGLERRTARGGRDSIDHSPGAHDDLANSASGALVLASHHKVPLNFHVPVSIGRSAVMADFMAGFFDPGSCAQPGTYCPEAGGMDSQLLWTPNNRRN
jgi:hypothetical protein